MRSAREGQNEPLRNSRHEAFCQACLGMSQADAYRSAFAESAKNYKAKTIHEKACRLARRPEVAARIAWLKARAADRAILTHEECCAALSSVIRAVMAEGERLNIRGAEYQEPKGDEAQAGYGLAYDVEFIDGGEDGPICKRKMRDLTTYVNRLSQMMGYDKPKKLDVRDRRVSRPLRTVPDEVLVRAVEKYASGKR
ncbi:MAG: hypothetical protein ABFD89_16615 [Bryobacteraceae bacterium]